MCVFQKFGLRKSLSQKSRGGAEKLGGGAKALGKKIRIFALPLIIL